MAMHLKMTTMKVNVGLTILPISIHIHNMNYYSVMRECEMQTFFKTDNNNDVETFSEYSFWAIARGS